MKSRESKVATICEISLPRAVCPSSECWDCSVLILMSSCTFSTTPLCWMIDCSFLASLNLLMSYAR